MVTARIMFSWNFWNWLWTMDCDFWIMIEDMFWTCFVMVCYLYFSLYVF